MLRSPMYLCIFKYLNYTILNVPQYLISIFKFLCILHERVPCLFLWHVFIWATHSRLKKGILSVGKNVFLNEECVAQMKEPLPFACAAFPSQGLSSLFLILCFAFLASL